jgi:hypothetical protein
MDQDDAYVNEWGGVSLAVGSGYQRKVPSHGHADKGVRAPMKENYQTKPCARPATSRFKVSKLRNEAKCRRKGERELGRKGENYQTNPP